MSLRGHRIFGPELKNVPVYALTNTKRQHQRGVLMVRFISQSSGREP